MSILKKVQQKTLNEEAENLVKKFIPFTDTDASNFLSAIEQGTLKNAINCSVICCEILIENKPGIDMLNPYSQLEWKEHWEEVIKILKSK